MKKIVPVNASLIPEQAERVFKGQIFDVYQWQQEMFDGTFETFELLKRPDTVQILAVQDGEIIVLHEEQPGRPPFYDIPAGRHDKEGESELEGAKRELLEETGMTFNQWKLVDVRQPQHKIEWFIYTFLATDFVSQQEQNLDNGEKIEVSKVAFEEYRKMHDEQKLRFWPEILDNVTSLDELIALPEYQGKEIER